MNIKTKIKYERIKKLTKLKSYNSIEILINRSVGYFNKIVNDGKIINKGHIQNYFFILEDIVNINYKKTPKINYGTNNKIIIEYGTVILKMRYKDNYSFTMIVDELRTRYKKKISRTMIYNFSKLNKEKWTKYYE